MRKMVVSFVACCFFIVMPMVAGAESLPEKVDPGQVAALQEKMMADPAIMKLIMQLQSNPDIQSVLNDPAMRDALGRGDVEKLLQDPRFLNLMSNPVVKEIGNQLE